MRARQRAIPLWLTAAAVVLGLAWMVLLALTPSGAARVASIPTDAELSAGGRPVLYHFSAEWCGPCRRMEHEVLADDDAAALIAGLYTRVDVLDRQREEGRNPARVDELEHRYHVRAFPTLVIAAPGGEELDRLEGYPGREHTLAFLRTAGGAPEGPGAS